MRQVISIGILTFHLGLFTEFGEVMRLPILVQHFIEHREQLPSMSFFQFLAMHYETDTPHDATDMELPFKDTHNCCTTPTFALLEQKVILPAEIPVIAPEFFSAYISFIPASSLDEIFQPPRA